MKRLCGKFVLPNFCTSFRICYFRNPVLKIRNISKRDYSATRKCHQPVLSLENILENVPKKTRLLYFRVTEMLIKKVVKSKNFIKYIISSNLIYNLFLSMTFFSKINIRTTLIWVEKFLWKYAVAFF